MEEFSYDYYSDTITDENSVEIKNGTFAWNTVKKLNENTEEEIAEEEKRDMDSDDHCPKRGLRDVIDSSNISSDLEAKESLSPAAVRDNEEGADQYVEVLFDIDFTVPKVCAVTVYFAAATMFSETKSVCCFCLRTVFK